MEEVFNDGIYECIVVATNVEKYKVTSKVTVILQIRDDISATELKNTNKIYAGYRLKLEYWQKRYRVPLILVIFNIYVMRVVFQKA